MKKSLIFLFFLWAIALQAVSSRDKSVKVACIGNSITYGYGLPDRGTQAYPVLLQEMLGSSYEVRNFGKSGATLLRHGHRPYVCQQEWREAKAFAADIVVIHLGINDTDPRNWPNYRDEFIGDYRALIDTCRQLNPQCRILIARLTPLTFRHKRFESGTRDWRSEINACIERVATGAGVELIDLEEPLYHRPDLFPDAVHPNAEGTEILAKTVCQSITGDYGGLKMSCMYSDYMVLPRERLFAIEGRADRNESVEVSIDGKRYRTQASHDGRWRVEAGPLAAGGPYTLKVSAPSRKLVYKDVLAGEIWLCSGQSNMEFRLKESATASRDIPLATCNDIRLYDMKARWRTDNVEWTASSMDSVNRLLYVKTDGWMLCTPETAAEFTAVGYYFGKELRDSLHVPVGLVCNAVGGTGIESWVDRKSLELEFPAVQYDWLNNDFNQEWVRGRAKKNIAKATSAMQRHPYEPCYMFEAGILPMEKFPIAGVIWYQGESNAHNIEAHDRLFGLLVDGWRDYWQNDTMPFYYVQISGMKRPSWPWFRDAQRLLLDEYEHINMAVSSDCGEPGNVHPRRKEPVGHRLALLALHDTYEVPLVCNGPLFESLSFEQGKAIVSFANGEGLHTSDGKELRTFEMCGDDGVFYPCAAKVINGTMVMVSSPQVPDPVTVRYGWQPYTTANLVNGADLPASTFRSDTGHPKTPTDKVLFRTVKDSVYYRIPAIASTVNGTLVAVSDDRYTHGRDVGWALPIDILCRLSQDGGETWGAPLKIADCHDSTYAATIYGFGDAALVADRESDRQMILCVGDSTGRPVWRNGAQQVYRFYGSKDGSEWENGVNISHSIYKLLPQLNCLFIGSGKIHQSRYVKKGDYYRLYCSLLSIRYGNAVIYSDDFGESWNLLGDTVSCCPKGDEPKTEELPDGSVILSSRTQGRYFNIFRFDDDTFTTGHWEQPALSSDIIAQDNACNGEIMALEAYDNRSKQPVWLYLQSVPYGPKRSHVSIYYKALPLNADFSTISPESFGLGWNRFEVTPSNSSYSTFCLTQDGHIAFIYERTDATMQLHDTVFQKLTIEEITSGRYTFSQRQ